MKHSFKRILSLVLTFAMVLSCVPAQVFATESCEHSYEVTVAEPTCTEDGSIAYTCSLCGDSYSEPGVAAQGHDYQEAAYEAATCAAPGSVTYECTVCGDTLADELPAAGEHSYAEGICALCGAEDPDAAPAEEPTEEPAEEPTEEIVELPAPEYNADEGSTEPTDGRDVQIPATPNFVAQLGEDGDKFESLAEAVAAAADITTDRPFVSVLQDCEVTETILIDTDINIFYIGEDGNNPTITAAEGVDTLLEIGENGALLVNNVDFVNTGDYVVRLTADNARFQTSRTNISGAAAVAILVDNCDATDIQLYDSTVSGAVALELNGSNANVTVADASVLTGNSTSGAIVVNGDGNVVDVLLAQLANDGANVAFTLNGSSTIKANNFNGQDYNPTTDPIPCAGTVIRYDINYVGNLAEAAALAAAEAYDEQYPDRTLSIDILSDVTVSDTIEVTHTNYPVCLTMAGDATLTVGAGGRLDLNGTVSVVGNLKVEVGGAVNVHGPVDMGGAVVDAPEGSITLWADGGITNMADKNPIRKIYEPADEAAVRDALTDFQNEGYGAAEIIPQSDITLTEALQIPAGVKVRLTHLLEVPVSMLESFGYILIDGGTLHILTDGEALICGPVTVEDGGQFINDGCVMDCQHIDTSILTGSGEYIKYDPLMLEMFNCMANGYGWGHDVEYTLSGNLSIKVGDDKHFHMDPGSSIIVPDGCTLWIRSRVMLLGDARIIVEAGGKLIIDEITHVGTGTVHVCDGAEVEDNVGTFDLSRDGETDDFISAYFVNSENGIYHEMIDQFGYTPSYDWRMEPGTQNPLIFYFNHWNGEYWDRTPIAADELTLSSGLTVETIGAENAREDQTNGDCFLNVKVGDDVAWDTQETVTVNGVSFNINIQRDYNWGFYSDKVASNDTWLRDVSFGPDMENSFFLIVTNEDMTLKRVETTVWAGPDELSGAVVCMKYDNNIWKFQLDEEVAADMSRNLWLNVRATLVDADGNEYTWDRGINCQPWVWSKGMPDATLTIDGLEYSYYADFDRYMYWDPETESEWEGSLPEGVSYDLESNTLTLNNADLNSFRLNYGYPDDYWGTYYCLPNADFKLNLVGENYIRNSSDVALRLDDSLSEGFTVTICGEGSLYVENTNNPGTPGAVNAADVNNVELIIGESANVTFHVEGQNQWDDGNDAWMHGLQGSNTSTLRIQDSATLTMETPEILNDQTDDFDGGWRGLANFKEVIVEDQATVNLDILELYYDEETGIRQQFYQRGGTVNINSHPSIVVDEETGETKYWYDPININDGSRLHISGGKLNVDAVHNSDEPAETQLILVNDSTMQVSGGQIILSSNVPGKGIYVSGDSVSRLYFTGGTLTNYKGSDDATFLCIGGNGRATFASGTIRTDGGLIEFAGETAEGETPAVLWTGTTLQGYGNTISVDGNFKMSGGLIQLNDGRVHVENSALFTGGTLDMNDSVMIVNGTATVEGGAKLDFDMTKAVEDGTAIEMNNTMTISGNARIDIDIALENTQDENGEDIYFAGIHNFGNMNQNGGTVNINSNAAFTDDIVSRGNLTLNSGEMNLTGISGIQMDKNEDWENAGNLTVNEGMTLNVDTTRNGINLLGQNWFNGGSVNINVEGTDTAFGIYVMTGGILDVYDGIHSVKVTTTEDTDGIGIVADGASVNLMGGTFTVDAEQAMTCWAIEGDAATIGFADLVDVETGVQLTSENWSSWVDENGKNNFDLILPGEGAGTAKYVRLGGEPVTLQSVLPNLEVSGGRYMLAQAVVVEESMDLAIEGQPVILDVIRGGKITVRNGAVLTIPEGAHLVTHDNEEDNDTADGTIIVESGSALVNNGLIANDGGVFNVLGSYSASADSTAVSHYANGAFTLIQGVDASYQEINANIADADQLKEIVKEILDTTQDGEKIRYQYAYIWTPNSMSLDGITIPEDTELAIDGQDATAVLTVSEGAVCMVSGKLSLGNTELTVDGRLNNFGEIHTDIHDNAKITVKGTFFVSDAGKTFLNQADMTINGEYTHWQESCSLDINDGSVVTVAASGKMLIRGDLGVGHWKMNAAEAEEAGMDPDGDYSYTAGTLNVEGQVEINDRMHVREESDSTGGIVNIKDGGSLFICSDPPSDIYGYLDLSGIMNIEAGGTLEMENYMELFGTVNVDGTMNNRGEVNLYGELNVSGTLRNQVSDDYYGNFYLYDSEDGAGAKLIAAEGANVYNDGSIRSIGCNGLIDMENAAIFDSSAESAEVCLDWGENGALAEYKGIDNTLIYLIYEGSDAAAAADMAAYTAENGYRSSIVRVAGDMEIGYNQSLDCDYLIVMEESSLEVNGFVNAHTKLNVRAGGQLIIGTNGWIISDTELNAFGANEEWPAAVIENRGTLECGPNGTMGFYGDYNDFGVGSIYKIMRDGSMGQIEGVGTDAQTLFANVMGENGEQQLRDLIDMVNQEGYRNAIVNILTEVNIGSDLDIPENVRVRVTTEGENTGSMTIFNDAYVNNMGTIVTNQPYAALLVDLGSYGGNGIYHGYCGNSEDPEALLWTLQDGVLTISGAGAMADYAYESPAPWLNLNVSKIVPGSGVTYIGDYAFQKCYASMIIPKGLQYFGTYCFGGGMNLKVYHNSGAEAYLQENYSEEWGYIHEVADGVCIVEGCGYGLEDALTDPLTTAQDKAEELKNFDTESLKDAMEEAEKDKQENGTENTLIDQLEALEQDILDNRNADSDTKLDVGVRLDENVSDTVADAFENVDEDASILGAVLNAEEGVSEVHLVLGDPEDAHIDEENYDAFNRDASVLFSMTLQGVGNDAQLAIPVKITLPVPANIGDLTKLAVMHYHDGSDEGQKVNFTLFTDENGKAFISFVITGFSNFLVGEEATAATLRATVKPNTVTKGADPDDITISISHYKNLNTNYKILNAQGEEVELEEAVQTPGTYKVIPTYVPNSQYNVTVDETATLTVQEAAYACVNSTTNEQFESVSAALAAAKTGETVRLIQDYTEKDEIILRTGVTLDVGKYTLTAENHFVGLDGSYLDGDPFDIDGTYGKVVPQQSFTMLTDGAYVDEKNYSILPIYYNDGYVFSRMEVNTDQNKGPNRGLAVDTENKQIRFQFVTNMTGDVRRNILNDGITGNHASIVVRLEWEVVGGDDIAYQDFVYNDSQIAAICSGGSDFTFTMVGYDALNIDLETLTVKGIVKTDCGVVEYGTVWEA